MSKYEYLGGLVSQCGIKIKLDKDNNEVIIEIDGKVKKLTLLEAKAFASELLIDSTFYTEDGDYKYHGSRWEQNWCYDADITLKFKRSD